jgi:hypothetical protein
MCSPLELVRYLHIYGVRMLVLGDVCARKHMTTQMPLNDYTRGRCNAIKRV